MATKDFIVKHGLVVGNDAEINGTGAVKVSSGTTAERPSSPENGMIRYNTDLASLEQYVNGSWGRIGTDLTNTANSTTVAVESSTGSNTTILAANSSTAGVMSAADKSKLDGIEANAKDDQTITAGTGLTGGGTGDVTISHADTSTQTSVNNSNGNVIQDVTLDGFGHVTALGSIDLDTRYYTETEADSLFVNTSGDTITGNLEVVGTTSFESIAKFVSPDTNSTITVTMLNSDTLSFSGDSGQLFSITDSLTGTIFAVNDISGVPSIEVDDDGTIRLAETFGNLLIGTATDDGTNKVQIDGSLAITGALSANGTIGTTGQTLRSDGTKAYWSTEVGYTGSQGVIGYTGSKGDLGYTGSIGFTGSQGPIGYTGSQGVIGYTGSQGIQGIQGFTGSQGIQGIQGFTGSQGVIGYTGSQGDQGVIGYTGSKGDQGVIGYTGSRGVIGYTGSKGDIGYTGSKGDIGYTGSQGIQGVIGYTGSEGPVAGTSGQLIYNDSGVAGGTSSVFYDDVNDRLGLNTVTPGYLLDVNGDTNITGNLTVGGDLTVFGNNVVISATTLSVEDNMIYLNANSSTTNPDLGWAGNYNDGTYAHAGFFRDATDGIFKPFDGYTPEPDTGPEINTGHASFNIAPIEVDSLYIDGYGQVINSAGEWVGDPDTVRGYTGSQGPIGYTGSRGVTGFTGSLGFTGSKGDIGYTGSQGIQGIQGYTGSQGIQGVIGYTGSRGVIGYTGSQGIQGIQGYTGSQGIQGIQGFTGSQGIQGVIGYTGSQGVIGYTGSQGIQGVIGYTGSRGATGFTGSQGVIGYTGSQGVIGYTGSKGDTGFTGSQGVIGYTGSEGPVAGANTNIIYNQNGLPAGSANLTWDFATNTLNLRNALNFVSPDGTDEILVEMLNGGSLSFEGTSGQLFSITDTLTGTIFSVNDISGIPSIEVDDDGTIRFAEFSGNVLIGTATDDGTNKVQVDGNIAITGALSANGSIGTSGQTLRSDGTKSYWSTEVGYTGSQGVTGFTGSQGVIGYTGSKGDIGYTGSQGPVAGTDGQVIYNNGGISGGANLYYDDVNNRVGVKNSSPAYDLDVTGTTNISSDLLVGGSVTMDNLTIHSTIETVVTTASILSPAVIDTYSATTYAACKYLIYRYSPSSVGFNPPYTMHSLTELLVLNSDQGVTATQYGDLNINTSLGTATSSPSYFVDLVSGNITLSVEATGTYRIVKILIKTV